MGSVFPSAADGNSLSDHGADHDPPPRPQIVRKLIPNLPSEEVLKRLRESERLSGAGERETGYYLLEVKRRKLFRMPGCSSFRQFIGARTGLGMRKAQELMAVAKALEGLPLLDGAFSRGELYWSAVRALARVATAETEKRWIECALGRPLEEVERRVAASKRGDHPGNSRFRGSPVRYPYRLNVPPEVHQAIESLTRVLSLRRGREATVDEAIFEAVKDALGREISKDEADGKEGKLPSAYRVVIHLCPRCRRTAAATPDGPVEISVERALDLLDGAEMLVLEESRAGTIADPVRSLTIGKNAHTCAHFESQTLVDSQPAFSPIIEIRKYLDEAWEGGKAGEKAGERAGDKGPPAPQGPLIEHTPDLSTPERPLVPPEKRDRPSTPEERRSVLSRDGYFCSVPGCGGLARFCHHLVWRAQGGRTVLRKLSSLCGGCHDLAHEGSLLLSGTAEELIASGRGLRPLIEGPGSEPSCLLLEVETPPAPPAALPELAETDPPSSISPLEPDIEVKEAIPAEISPAWWLSHRHLFEWSERRKLLTYHPERRAAEGESVLAEPPAGEVASSAPGLEGFRGQGPAVERLSTILRAAKLRGETPAPLLLSGPPGVGKTSLARLAAGKLGKRLHSTAGPLLQDPGALMGILSSLKKGEALFIDEVHGMARPVAECFYQALDEGKLSITIASGAETRLATLKLEPFFLIGATTEESALPRPFHSRFQAVLRLDLYSPSDLEAIAIERGRALGVEVTPEAARRLALGSRGTPRDLMALLRGARDVAQLEAGRAGAVTVGGEVAEGALRLLGVDAWGLREPDRRILRALDLRGRPLGLRTLSDLTGEASRTLLEIHEPFLLREGYLVRTFRGRMITEKGRRLLAG